MLGEFDYARRELTTIKKRLQELATPAPQGESRELSFLKARTLDLLQHIYVDSKLTLDHISETFKTASTKQVLEAVGRALLVGPPLRRAFGSEDDGRTVQVLIDAAVWRSKFVWVCGIIFIAAMGVLGFSITDLSKQGDLVRKTLLEARAQADQNIKILNDGIREIEAKRAEVEVRRKEIIAQIEALETLIVRSTRWLPDSMGSCRGCPTLNAIGAASGRNWRPS